MDPYDFFGTTDPVNAQMPSSTATESGSLGGLLTGILGYGAAKVIDAKFPTGNTTALNAAAQTALAQQNAKAVQTVAPFNWKPYAIGGGIAAGVALLVYVIAKASK